MSDANRYVNSGSTSNDPSASTDITRYVSTPADSCDDNANEDFNPSIDALDQAPSPSLSLTANHLYIDSQDDHSSRQSSHLTESLVSQDIAPSTSDTHYTQLDTPPRDTLSSSQIIRTRVRHAVGVTSLSDPLKKPTTSFSKSAPASTAPIVDESSPMHRMNSSTVTNDYIEFRSTGRLTFDRDERDKSLPKKLGTGGFGSVYRARTPPEKPPERVFAIKQLKVSDHFSSRALLRELMVHRSLNHPNVVTYQAMRFCVASQFTAFIAIEHCDFTLYDLFIPRQPALSLPAIQIFQYLEDIAAALHYLHALNTPVMHLDLFADNILIAFDNVAKLCDFGVAISRSTASYTSRPLVRDISNQQSNYLPPELLLNLASPSTKSDVWMYGSLILWVLHAWEAVAPSGKTDWVSRLKNDVVTRCHMEDPLKRPTMLEVWQDLQKQPGEYSMASSSSIEKAPQKDDVEDRKRFRPFWLAQQGSERLLTLSDDDLCLSDFSHWGWDVVCYAILSSDANDEFIMQLLFKSDSKLAPCHLFCAGLQGRTSLFEEIKERFSNNETNQSTLLDMLNSTATGSPEGWTTLQAAVYKKHIETVQWLICNGANVNGMAKIYNETALHVAAMTGATRIAELLLQSGAIIDQVDRAKITPLLIASASGNVDVMRLLLTSGADILATHHEGWNSLHMAIHVGSYRGAALLLGWDSSKLKALLSHRTATDRNDSRLTHLVKDYPEFTPLEFATYAGKQRFVDLILLLSTSF